MQMTVEQALNVYPLSEGRLVAGAKGKGRIVKSVNVMDAPDIADWVKEGEMLFTTAYLIKDNLNEAEILLRKLHYQGLAGLGVKLGRFWDAIPQRLIDKADELGLPLIELPYQFTFSDQMNGLFHAEMKRNTVLLEQVLDRQVRLMRFALKPESVGSLFQAIEQIIECKIAVVGSKGQMIHNGSAIEQEHLLDQWPWNHQKQLVRRRGWQALRVPFTQPELYSGFVYFIGENPYISPVEESLYVQAAELITHQLTFMYSDYLEQSAQKDFGLLIRQHLLNGMTVDVLEDYASRWEMEWLTKGYRCVLIEVDEVLDQATATERWNELRTAMLCHSQMQALKGIHIIVNDGIFSVIPEVEKDSFSRLYEVFNRCLDEFKWVDWRGPRVVIGTKKKQLRYLQDAHAEVKSTLRICRDWDMPEKVVSQEAFDLTLIFESVPQHKMKNFYEYWLGELLPGGDYYNEEMYLTLETYLDCDGQINETSKRLFVHRNTVAYRIDKLSEAMGIDLKQMNYVVRLKIAMMFYRILEGKRCS